LPWQIGILKQNVLLCTLSKWTNDKSIMTRFFISFFLFASVCLFAESAKVEVRALSDVQAISPGSSFHLGVVFTIAPGWHLYWQNPGDSGAPPTFVWQLPRGVRIDEPQWPHPEYYESGGLASYIYSDSVMLIFPVKIDSTVAGESLQINAVVDWLVCSDVCIPEDGKVNIEIQLANDVTPASAEINELFYAARAQLPMQLPGWRIAAVYKNSDLHLRFEGDSDPGGVHFFPYQYDLIDMVAEQELLRRNGGYELRIPLAGKQAETEITGVLVSENGWRGVGSERALQVAVQAEDAPSEAEGVGLGLVTALLFAFIGGVILNLMPCVLPVLSLKVMGFVEQAHGDRRISRQHGLAYGFGVLISFWLLAGLLIILRQSGAEIGWGFQLQEPLFVLAMLVLFFLFALNMFGVFEVGTLLTRLTMADQHVSTRGAGTSLAALRGSFFSGILATLVATPCTAPFMGSALGFALAQPLWVGMLAFTALGAGMAMPIVLLAMNPAWLRFIPQPGAWMDRLKQFFGFLLLATGLWLFWVLSLQVAAEQLSVVLAILLISAFGAWVYGHWGSLQRSNRSRRLAALFFIASFLFPLVFFAGDMRTQPPSSPQLESSIWQTYDDQLLSQARENGQAVFIDFTAAWCLSCQVNKKVALESTQVVNEFARRDVLLLRGDWTNRDKRITRALAEYGRNSVPLYVYYAPDGNEGKLLPEILTPEIVINAITE
jgi:thiol:disulfide interchange protein